MKHMADCGNCRCTHAEIDHDSFFLQTFANHSTDWPHHLSHYSSYVTEQLSNQPAARYCKNSFNGKAELQANSSGAWNLDHSFFTFRATRLQLGCWNYFWTNLQRDWGQDVRTVAESYSRDFGTNPFCTLWAIAGSEGCFELAKSFCIYFLSSSLVFTIYTRRIS